MRILVVEPHPDDAFLSAGWHLEHLWKGYERTILTVYSNDKRKREAYHYAKSIGADSIVLGLNESRMDSIGPIEREEVLDKALSNLEFDRIVFPLGLQHPDHFRVAACATPNCWRYLDTPYQTKQKLQVDLLDKVSGMQVISMCYPSARKWNSIPIFQSQSKFFHFNPMKNLCIPEIILADRHLCLTKSNILR